MKSLPCLQGSFYSPLYNGDNSTNNPKGNGWERLTSAGDLFCPSWIDHHRSVIGFLTPSLSDVIDKDST